MLYQIAPDTVSVSVWERKSGIVPFFLRFSSSSFFFLARFMQPRTSSVRLRIIIIFFCVFHLKWNDLWHDSKEVKSLNTLLRLLLASRLKSKLFFFFFPPSYPVRSLKHLIEFSRKFCATQTFDFFFLLCQSMIFAFWVSRSMWK